MMDGSGEDNAEADYHSLVTLSAGEYVRAVEGETEHSVKKRSLSRKAEFVKCEEHGKIGRKSWTAIKDECLNSILFESSTALPNGKLTCMSLQPTAAVFRLMRNHHKLETKEYADNLITYLDSARTCRTITLDDLSNVLHGLSGKAKNGTNTEVPSSTELPFAMGDCGSVLV